MAGSFYFSTKQKEDTGDRGMPSKIRAGKERDIIFPQKNKRQHGPNVGLTNFISPKQPAWILKIQNRREKKK
ncbi:MAG: hypothetical protein D6714_01745 [Bacteroidetes bacterium]|nr:MAG: hypothetical protein D6714_01745 [Bacteroidota bacterium]